MRLVDAASAKVGVEGVKLLAAGQRQPALVAIVENDKEVEAVADPLVVADGYDSDFVVVRSTIVVIDMGVSGRELVVVIGLVGTEI